MSGIRRVRGRDATPLPLASMSCEGVAVPAGCSIARCVMRGGGQAVGALQAALTGHPAPPNPAGHGPPVRGRCGPPATRKAPATGSGQGQAAGHQVGRVQRLAMSGGRSVADALRPSRRGSVTSHPPAVSTQLGQMHAHAHRRCRPVRVDLPPRFAESQMRAAGLFRSAPCGALCVLPRKQVETLETLETSDLNHCQG